MRFEVLGPLRATVGVGAAGAASVGARSSDASSLGGPKQQLVLALLLADPSRTVTVDRLVDGVWGEQPPESARHTLQAYISELRKAVGDVIERDGSGYRITVDASTFDVADFEQRVASARTATSPDAAIDALEGALALWRGDPYEDFVDHEVIQAEAVRLHAIRLGAIEELSELRLDAGLHAEVVGELGQLTRQHPYREELRALQMIALYRCGRQAEALRAYQKTRELLAEELGIMPSPQLRQLEEQILLQDPELDRTADPGRPPHHQGVIANPYVGLRAFREGDHSRFFGRDDLIAALIERIATGGFTALVGPSGSGKSSAVQAGLIPWLRRDRPGLPVALMKPGAQPFAELDVALDGFAESPPGEPYGDRLRSLASSRSDSPSLLVIDQFEELFTMVDAPERARFATLLAEVATARDAPVHVLVTLRADCYDRPLADPHLARVFADNVVNVPVLGPAELEAAAVGPARQLDIALEPRLVGRLITDVAGQPNALPLFQYALTELCDERDGAVLDLTTYERIGGVRKAVARRAESVFAHLDDAEQAAARQLFLRIATVSDDIVGKRRVPASELVSLDVDVVALRAAIDAFARYRLLVLDRDPVNGAPTVEVAHEALLTEWHRLRDWIDDHRDDLAKQAAFALAVDEWERAERDDGYLLTGSRLADYERWAQATALRLTTTEQDFLDEAVSARDRAADERARRDADRARLKQRSRRQLAALFAACAALAALIAYPILSSESDPDTIAVALAGPPDAGGFDALVARGFDSTADEFDMEGVRIEPPYTDLTSDLREVLAEDPALMYGSFLLHERLLAMAPDHPDTTFMLLDYNFEPPLPNTVGVGFAVEEGSFLVGAAAVLETQTGKVGYIGANPVPFIEAFRAGFEQGAAAADPDVEVVTALIDPGQLGYDAPDAAYAIASEMYRDDVDVIFVAAGGSGSGALRAAVELSGPERELWMIGVDSDVYFQVGDEKRARVLTSMVKRFDEAIRVTTAAHLDGSLVPGDTVFLTLADDAVGYTESGGHLDPATIARLEEYKAEITSGARGVAHIPAAPVSHPATPGGAAALD